MRTILIRHGRTIGNTEGRYIGCRSDEPLCEEGIAALRLLTPPAVDLVFCSPMRRCLETAAILYPEHRPRIIHDFRECDFGAFEGHNYAELNGDPVYQAWIDSGGENAFPGGESRAEMEKRTAAAFRPLLENHRGRTAAVIAHGGTLMALMAGFAIPSLPYFRYWVNNGEGYILEPDGSWQRLAAPKP